MAYIEVENLKYRYPNTKKLALDGLQFQIEKGSFVGIVGENGAGKSTLCQAFSGLVPQFFKGAYGGKVMIGNQDAAKTPVSGLCRTVGLVFQNPFNQLSGAKETVFEEIAFGLQNFGVPREEMIRRVQEVMELLDISEYKERNPFDLSGGQMQRVALAGILAMQPEVIVLDEPTSFLDVRYKLELLAILERMARKKHITVIMSLHEIDLAQKVSDKIICVKGDTIAHYGKPEEVFKEDTIRSLYEIDNGSFDPVFGSIELPKIEGEPEVFVISSGGSGIPIYRQLQKEHIPFAAGILYKNDIDYQLARLLAVEVITEEPFRQISDETFARAVEVMKKCKRVIVTDVPVGECNKRIEELIKLAK